MAISLDSFEHYEKLDQRINALDAEMMQLIIDCRNSPSLMQNLSERLSALADTAELNLTALERRNYNEEVDEDDDDDEDEDDDEAGDLLHEIVTLAGTNPCPDELTNLLTDTGYTQP